MTFADFLARAIGVPFVPFGRDYDGWDCYGLLVVAYRDVAGVTIPDFTYDDVYNYRRLAKLFADRTRPHWTPVTDPVPMTAACIWRRGLPIHAGLVIPGRRILHVEEGIETCAPMANTFRVEGYYVPTSSGAASV